MTVGVLGVKSSAGGGRSAGGGSDRARGLFVLSLTSEMGDTNLFSGNSRCVRDVDEVGEALSAGLSVGGGIDIRWKSGRGNLIGKVGADTDNLFRGSAVPGDLRTRAIKVQKGFKRIVGFSGSYLAAARL